MAHPLLRLISMLRRLTAFLGMLLLVAIVTMLVWRVYLHHRAADSDDDVAASIAAA
jgi:hypothetical protein